VWNRGALSVADSPGGFAELALAMLEIETAQQARKKVSEIAHSSPTTSTVGKKISAFLSEETLE
jgi:hypothetical protein